MDNKVKRALQNNEKLKGFNIEITHEDGIIILSGEVDQWQTVVDIGHFVAKLDHVRNVVNHLTVKGLEIPRVNYGESKKKGLAIGEIGSYDVVIIGAGISGCGIARELSKYQLKTLVVEKEADLAEGATKANNGDIHPGHKAKPGTLKAKLNVKGNAMYGKWARELDFDLKRVGTISVGYTQADMEAIRKIYHDAIANQVPGIKMLTGEEIKQLEPNVIASPIGGLIAPTMAIVEPYLVALALAENAIDNGTEFLLDTEVADVLVQDGAVQGLVTSKGIIRTTYIINAAGLYTDDISKMAGDEFYTIHPRRGTILILDKKLKGLFHATISTVPSANNQESKGGGAQPTVEGNILLGPSAVEVPNKQDKSVDPSDIDYALARGLSVCDKIYKKDIISIFSGLRAADYKEDFIVEKSRKVDGFIHVAGIQSPGLASAPAIAEMVEDILKEDLALKGKSLAPKEDFNPIHKRRPEFRKMSVSDQEALIKKEPRYGHIICRCEQITEGEIIDALNSSIPPTTVDGVKRRSRAGMGRCQSGFCQGKVLELIANHQNIPWIDVTLKGKGTYILEKDNRESQRRLSSEKN